MAGEVSLPSSSLTGPARLRRSVYAPLFAPRTAPPPPATTTRRQVLQADLRPQRDFAKTITIEVKGDSKKEADETFYLDLFGLSSNALFTKTRGTSTILNDD